MARIGPSAVSVASDDPPNDAPLESDGPIALGSGTPDIAAPLSLSRGEPDGLIPADVPRGRGAVPPVSVPDVARGRGDPLWVGDGVAPAFGSAVWFGFGVSFA
jgi:hypothetical protein